MRAVVVDASALAFSLTSKAQEAAELRGRLGVLPCHAPHVIDAEVGNVLRKQELTGEISAVTAIAGLRALPQVIDHRWLHTGHLAEIAWQLRKAITFYDALYVALAAMLDVPLLSSDARLSKAPKLPCTLELVTSS